VRVSECERERVSACACVCVCEGWAKIHPALALHPLLNEKHCRIMTKL
jgi:hypothetical protein